MESSNFVCNTKFLSSYAARVFSTLLRKNMILLVKVRMTKGKRKCNGKELYFYSHLNVILNSSLETSVLFVKKIFGRFLCSFIPTPKSPKNHLFKSFSKLPLLDNLSGGVW